MVKKTRVLILASAACLLQACDLGDYPALGELRDDTQVLGPGATTWVAFESSAVTLLVLGGSTGDGPPHFALTRLGGVGGDESRSGTYALDESAHTLTLSADLRYYGDATTAASGNARESIDETRTYDLDSTGGRLVLTGTSGTPPLPSFRDFRTVVSQLDVSTAEGARCAVELLHVTTGSAELRMTGFGGFGTIEYTRPAVFRGQLEGSVRLSLDDVLSPLTQFVYDDFSDFGGYTTSGTKATKTDTSGNGTLYGTLHFEIAGAAAGGSSTATSPISGDVRYGESGSAGIQLRGGNEAGGGYTVSFDGGASFDVPYDAPTALHLVVCFPEFGHTSDRRAGLPATSH